MSSSLYPLFCLQFPLLLCIILIHVTPFACTTSSITRKFARNETDEVALKVFKSKIVLDRQGVLNSWNESHHFCVWEGITCSRRHRRVTRLDLRSRGLVGSLSPHIGNLSFLRELILSNNSIKGEIPRDLGNLFRLEVLYLSNNSLVGEIPAKLSQCSKLTTLLLQYNKLVGRIPPEFVSLDDLQILALHRNNLTGSIPLFLGNLTSLEVISLGYNAFGGTIPDSLGQLKKLTFLELSRNNLSGTVPCSLYNLSFLVDFDLAENQLHGRLPTTLGLTLPNLKSFQLSRNFFTGYIPISLSNASKLELIEVRGNNFFGKMIVDFGRMHHLNKLNLGFNKLGSGEGGELEFINSLANCSNLRVLGIEFNQFKGALPHSLANLSTTLQRLSIVRNQLYGSIPYGLANLISLNALTMSLNHLTGPIPEEIGMLQNLQVFSCRYNQFFGEIPSSLGNLSLLSSLSFANNKLSGAIPASFGNLKQLSLLDLSQNNLNGTIPKQIFDISSLTRVNLSHNHLVGSIPQNIGNLKATTKIDVSNNNLSGEIPSELSFCSSLEYLYMEDNLLLGSIPSTLSSLKGIREIDFSCNNLSGQIPKFLETLSLEYLNLSFNNLEGEVPKKGIFRNASVVSVVGNSDRLCGGIIELQLSKCPNSESKNKKLSSVFKILIAIASVICGLTMIVSFMLCRRKRRRNDQISSVVHREALLKVSYEKLLKATGGFSSSHLIGVGGFGSVFKGVLDHDGSIIAVKVLNLQCQGAFKSFMAECKALKNIRHRNLVRVITSCSSIDFQGNDFKAIIYEFMVNGNLEKWLYSVPTLRTEEEHFEIQSLTLLHRVSIAIDVASALDYLHHYCEGPILHCDLKPSNVLLDGDMTAHVGDFGLSKFFPEVSISNQNSSLGMKGTIGYIAPEYGLGSEVSTNGDIYSYGILLLEMVTRRKPTDDMFEGDFNLHNFAKRALPDQVLEIVDPILVNEEVAAPNHRMRQAINNNRYKCLIKMVRIGIACSMELPQDRMNISNVVHELQSVRNILLQPTTRLNLQRGQ